MIMQIPPKDPPRCPKCGKPMQSGRTKIPEYPHNESFECWLCLEVAPKNAEPE